MEERLQRFGLFLDRQPFAVWVIAAVVAVALSYHW